MTTAVAAYRILVVDDDPAIRHMLTATLEDEGHAVREAANGADALVAVQAWRPDLIVLDLMMPVMNGWQFAETYGSLPPPHAPIVVITAAGPGAIQSAEHLGTISAVLGKPIDLEVLHDSIDAHLGRTPR